MKRRRKRKRKRYTHDSKICASAPAVLLATQGMSLCACVERHVASTRAWTAAPVHPHVHHFAGALQTKKQLVGVTTALGVDNLI